MRILCVEFAGSDDFNLYMWKIPSTEVKWVESAHMVLRGHRSIVNQVRYNQASCIFASSGVEKIIKIWSPFPLGAGSLGGLKVRYRACLSVLRLNSSRKYKARRN